MAREEIYAFGQGRRLRTRCFFLDSDSYTGPLSYGRQPRPPVDGVGKGSEKSSPRLAHPAGFFDLAQRGERRDHKVHRAFGGNRLRPS
jgi:hypothetical protein